MEKTLKRKAIDKMAYYLFLLSAIISASIIIFIIIFIISKGIMPFLVEYKIGGKWYKVDFIKFIFGNTWFISPNKYGVGFIVLNTMFVVGASLLLSVPISIITALFIVRMSPKWLGTGLNCIVELLSSIPSVIYGIYGMGVVTSHVRSLASFFNISTAGGLSNLAVIIVLAMMIMPTITILSVSAIKSVKKNIIEGSLALGASKIQTDFKIVLCSSKGGIFAGIILGMGRALGEATAVSLVAGNVSSGPNFNLFSITRTLTSTMLLGLKETMGLDYDIRFSVGIVLIILIVVSNLVLMLIKRKIEK